jgi:DNA polymerase-3 subunit delta'
MSEEPDQQEGALHPRETLSFVGHEEAERELADALGGTRLHHAWLLTGPQGIGKATLAYRFARRLLGAQQSGARPLDARADDPIVSKIMSGSHPDLRVLKRGLNDRGDRLRRDISAEDARNFADFFSLKSTEGGWRIAIIDAVDDLNRFGANALLKTLEEPPPRAMLILICHSPGAILPTIRSRCRRLVLRPLTDEQVEQASPGVKIDESVLRLAAGRPGRAIALQAAGAGDIATALEDSLNSAGKTGPAPLLSLAFERGGPNSAQRLDLVLDAGQDWLARRAERAADTADLAAKFAVAWSDLSDLRDQSDELGLDPNHGLARAMQILYRAAA